MSKSSSIHITLTTVNLVFVIGVLVLQVLLITRLLSEIEEFQAVFNRVSDVTGVVVSELDKFDSYLNEFSRFVGSMNYIGPYVSGIYNNSLILKELKPILEDIPLCILPKNISY